VRSGHQLLLARQGLDALCSHLHQHWAQRSDAERRAQLIQSVRDWVGGLMTQWSGFVAEDTGAPLPWWEARRMVMRDGLRVARAAYEQAPDAYRARHPYAGTAAVPVAGFTRVDAPLREPGEEG
jgi:hypothetical protein